MIYISERERTQTAREGKERISMIKLLIFVGLVSANPVAVVDQVDGQIVTVELSSGEIVHCDAGDFASQPVEGETLSPLPTSCK